MARKPLRKEIEYIEDICVLMVIELLHINAVELLDERQMLMLLAPDILERNALHELLLMCEMRLRIIAQLLDEIHNAIVFIRDQLIMQQIIRLIRELEQPCMFLIDEFYPRQKVLREFILHNPTTFLPNSSSP